MVSMVRRCAAALVVALVLQAWTIAGPVAGPRDAGFNWSTFFFDYAPGHVEATFELVSVINCAALGVWFGGIGGAVGGLACGVTGWA